MIIALNFLLIRKDLHDFLPDPDINAVTVSKALGRRDEQVVPFLDFTADIIGKAAIGIGDVGAPFKQENPGLFRQTSGPCGCGCASGHTADHDQFHMHGQAPSENGFLCIGPPYCFFSRMASRSSSGVLMGMRL